MKKIMLTLMMLASFAFSDRYVDTGISWKGGDDRERYDTLTLGKEWVRHYQDGGGDYWLG